MFFKTKLSIVILGNVNEKQFMVELRTIYKTRYLKFQVGMAKAELKLTSLGFWRSYSSANRAGAYAEILSVGPIFDAMMNEKLVIFFRL